MAYATQASVEGVLGRPLTAAEITALPALLASVDAYIESMTRRKFETPTTQSTRYYDVEHSKLLDVDPFISDSTHAFVLAYVDELENVIEVINTGDYEARPRNDSIKTYFQRRSTPWGTGCTHRVANIALTAFFGGGAVPADIAYAASWLAANALGQTSSLSLKSESIEGYSRTFADATSSNSVIQATFDKYHEVLI